MTAVCQASAKANVPLPLGEYRFARHWALGAALDGFDVSVDYFGTWEGASARHFPSAWHKWNVLLPLRPWASL